MPSKPGFSIIELLVVLLLISILGSLVLPTFFSKKQGVVKKEFISNFTTLVQEALHASVTNKKIHQLFFDFDQNFIVVKEQDINSTETDPHKQFKVIKDPSAKITIPSQLAVQNFFIQNNDEFGAGTTTHESWFYIMPDGTSQPVLINILDQDPDKAESDPFSISVNPFYSQVQSHDSFQTP